MDELSIPRAEREPNESLVRYNHPWKDLKHVFASSELIFWTMNEKPTPIWIAMTVIFNPMIPILSITILRLGILYVLQMHTCIKVQAQSFLLRECTGRLSQNKSEIPRLLNHGRDSCSCRHKHNHRNISQIPQPTPFTSILKQNIHGPNRTPNRLLNYTIPHFL